MGENHASTSILIHTCSPTSKRKLDLFREQVLLATRCRHSPVGIQQILGKLEAGGIPELLPGDVAVVYERTSSTNLLVYLRSGSCQLASERLGLLCGVGSGCVHFKFRLLELGGFMISQKIRMIGNGFTWNI